MEPVIRRARHQDAEDIIRVHETSIREICSRDYSPAEIEAWCGRKFKPSTWVEAMNRDLIWVVELNSRVEGFGHFAVMDELMGELMGLYFTPSICGKGLGRKLLMEILRVARVLRLREVGLFSTLTAKPFYEKIGFLQSGSDSTIEMMGVPIPCHPMRLILS